jgi:hypothetical protein
MMNYKRNFKVIIFLHLIGILFFTCLIVFNGTDKSGIVMLVNGVLLLSMVMQLLIYNLKPGAFGNKVNKHPGKP